MRLDLHLHSTASDGACAPSEVVRRAAEVRIDAIALADHDTTAGVAEAQEVGRARAVHVVPAIEVSSTWRGHDIHVLGYFVDPDAPVLERYAERARLQRERRMREMLEKLAALDVEVPFERVRRVAGDAERSLARPHLARALVELDYVASVPEAFQRYIGDDGPAFVPTRVQEPTDAVRLIRDAGGVPVWAHPPRDRIEPLLPLLADEGLRGLEVYRPNHRPDDVRRLKSWAMKFGLLHTGGSDWHGPDRGVALGEFYVTADEVEEFLDEGGM